MFYIWKVGTWVLTLGVDLQRDDRLDLAVAITGYHRICAGVIQFGIGNLQAIFRAVSDSTKVHGVFVVFGLQESKKKTVNIRTNDVGPSVVSYVGSVNGGWRVLKKKPLGQCIASALIASSPDR